MPQHIKAIETSYAGHRFRSRLEARWAVFFDTLGVRWEYEPEGFETSAGRYLPDFRIELYFPFPTWTWFEVKPEDAPDDPRHAAFTYGDGGDFLTIAKGMPRSFADQLVQRGEGRGRGTPIATLCPTIAGAAVWLPPRSVAFYKFQNDDMTLFETRYLGHEQDAQVDAAYAAARSARFEFGEVGR